jgi:hypothetical protein
MRTLLPFFFVLVFSLIACQPGSEDSERQRANMPGVSPQDFNVRLVQPGDFILKRGKGPISKLITDQFNETIPLSHCGIFVPKGDSLVIVHSVTKDFGDRDGVQEIAVNRFLLDCMKDFLYVVRFKGDTAKNREMASRAAFYAKERIPFDRQADNSNPEQMICTELLFWCMKDVYGKECFNRLKVGEKELLGFNGLLDTSNFEVVLRY